MASDLDKLYLPNYGSQRYSADVISQKHLEFTARESELARRSIPCDLNVPYGLRDREKIDIFGTDLPDEAPILIFVHGGYWQKEGYGRETYHFIAANFYKNKIKSIFIGYDLCPQVSMGEIVEEIATALEKCNDYAVEKKSRGLYVAGFSAGAHLVAATLTEGSPKTANPIKAIILISGIYDLTDIPKTVINEPLGLDEAEAVKLSPLKQKIKAGITGDFFVVSAGNDSPVFRKQSGDFHEKLQNSQLKSEFVTVDDVDHFNIVELLLEANYELSKLILSIIKT